MKISDGLLVAPIGQVFLRAGAVAALHPFAIASHRYADFHLLMPLFVCRSWAGEPVPREGQDIAWVAAADLGGYEMPAADTPLVAELRAALAAGP